jgi:hypothetical protein
MTAKRAEDNECAKGGIDGYNGGHLNLCKFETHNLVNHSWMSFYCILAAPILTICNLSYYSQLQK